ncbi:hypothetical protein MXD81_08615 [Microbacteriaceae bacterium K1510]|nr:hypothetical protein [Microbacteriaceae bacterium K1510]
MTAAHGNEEATAYVASHAHSSRLSSAFGWRSIYAHPADSTGREGIMEELITRLVANVGIDKAAAEKSVGIILEFLRKEGPADKVQALIDRLPGADALIAAQEAAGGGLFSMGGIMGAGTKMMAAGLNMGQVQAVARETLTFAREKAGEDTVGEIVGAVPGLSQFI